MATPAISNQLKVVVRIINIGPGPFGFHEKTNVSEIGSKKRVVGAPAPGRSTRVPLYFDLLLVGVKLVLVIDIPSESYPELIDEVDAGLELDITLAEKIVTATLKVAYKLSCAAQRLLELRLLGYRTLIPVGSWHLALFIMPVNFNADA
jgi:hypothetical protein